MKGEADMEIKVIYFSKTGNTKKIAKAIGEAVGVQAQAISEVPSLDKPVDLLFLGGALYFGSLNKDFEAWIKSLDPTKIKYTALFSTNNSEKDAILTMKAALEQKGILVVDERYHSLGKFLGFQKGHPDASEEAKAGEFARQVISLYFPPESEKEPEEADPAEKENLK